jgi:hypothetical protein
VPTEPGILDCGPLCDAIDALIVASDEPSAAGRETIERTLTDGYARALALEAEQRRLERAIGTVAAEIDDRNQERKVDELAKLSLELGRASAQLAALRDRLVSLRRRLPAAVA